MTCTVSAAYCPLLLLPAASEHAGTSSRKTTPILTVSRKLGRSPLRRSIFSSRIRGRTIQRQSGTLCRYSLSHFPLPSAKRSSIHPTRPRPKKPRDVLVLQNMRRRFKLENEREPLVWFDKYCIDQNAIDQSIRRLPIFVVASKKFFVLFGESYAVRSNARVITRTLALSLTLVQSNSQTKDIRINVTDLCVRNSLAAGACSRCLSSPRSRSAACLARVT
jgi:hypothetical protein